MDGRKHHVCPVEIAGYLDNRFRKWLQNPRKILDPFMKKGMTVLDIGCGPGFFTIEMAEIVGESGRVIASDLQEAMLRKLEAKIKTTKLEDRIVLHQCASNRIGVSEKVDFVLAFYVIHEIPDQEALFEEIAAILKPNGLVLIAEPLLHVSKRAFGKTVQKAFDAGFTPVGSPKILFSRTVIFQQKSEL